MATQPSNTPLVPAPKDFTAFDRDTILAVLRADVQVVFPAWTDFNRAAVGNIFLNAVAHVGDIVTKYQNDQMGEAYLSLARRRRNVLTIAKSFGIPLVGQGAASADLTFTLGATSSFDVVIPQGTRVSTVGLADTIDFFTTADLTIKAGQTIGVVSGKNATPRTDRFTSSGLADQRFRLTFDLLVEGTVTIDIGSTAFAEVVDFFSSGPSDNHFRVEVDEFERGFVIFGNGINGAVPAQADEIEFAYETGGGGDGNVGANTIKILGATFFDLGSNAVSLTVTNLSAATGGADRESIERARRRLHGVQRVNQRSVSIEDYEINALGVAGIARAMMLTTDEDPAVADNSGELIIIPEGDPPGVPSSDLKDQVKARVTVDFPQTLTFKVLMVDPTFNTIAVTADVKVKSGFTQPAVEQTIKDDLAAFFATQDANGAPNANVDFGSNLIDNVISFSDIFNVVRDAVGVLRVKKSTFLPADNVALAFRDFPKLGTVTISFL